MTEKIFFDAQGFHAALDAVRQSGKLSWRQVAKETSVSASTLTRLAQGSQPDATGLASLCKWSGLRAEDFLRNSDDIEASTGQDSLVKLTTVLRAAADLEDRDKDAIEDILKTAYRHFRQE